MILKLSISKARKTQHLMPLSRNLSFYSLSIVSTDWKMPIIAKYVKDAFATDSLEGRLKDDRVRIRDELIMYKN